MSWIFHEHVVLVWAPHWGSDFLKKSMGGRHLEELPKDDRRVGLAYSPEGLNQ